MGDFKNCLLKAVSTFLNKYKTAEMHAAVLVEKYTLTHKPVFLDRSFIIMGTGGASRGVPEGVRNLPEGDEFEKKSALVDTFIKTEKLEQPGKDVKCFYCKKKGHIIAECPMLGFSPAELVFGHHLRIPQKREGGRPQLYNSHSRCEAQVQTVPCKHIEALL